jgi:hypothetical protein
MRAFKVYQAMNCEYWQLLFCAYLLSRYVVPPYCALQVLEIQLAVKNKVKSFVFEGSELPLRPTVRWGPRKSSYWL